MKKTVEDAAFAAAFGRELIRHYERATSSKGSNLTDEDFAATLDVTRPALRKYLAGESMPSVRVLALAYSRYGIALEYLGTPLFAKRRRKRSGPETATQLVLPFSVRGTNAASIQAQIEPRGENGFELRVAIRKAS